LSARSLRKATGTSTVHNVRHSSFSKKPRAFRVGQIAGLEEEGNETLQIPNAVGDLFVKEHETFRFTAL